MSPDQVVADFLDFMRSLGASPRDPSVVRATGKLIRFEIEGDKSGAKNGFFRLHDDYPANGLVGNWKTGLREQWKPDVKPEKLWTEDERRAFAEKLKARQIAAAEELKQTQHKAAQVSQILWARAAERQASPHHPYLVRKNVKPHGLRETEDGKLMVPVTKNSQLVGIQFISSDGEKKFKFGTDMDGAYHAIGRPKTEVIICEGWATGATLHEATGVPVIVAFQANNILNVARTIRERLGPEARITIAADNDAWTKKPVDNPGVHYGREAATEIKAEIRIPQFRPGYEGKPTDFNDLAGLSGVDEVKHQLETGRPTWTVPAQLEGPIKLNFPDSVFFEPLPDRNAKGKPFGTIRNLAEVLSRIGARVRYNVINKKLEIMIEGHSYSLDNKDSGTLTDIIDACIRFQMPIQHVKEFLLRLADLNQYNPALDWVRMKPWDGVSRLQAFYDTVKAKDEHEPGVRSLKEALMRRWMISAIAAAAEPEGIVSKGCLVFQGAQNLGKTSWFKRLAPKELGILKDGVILNLADKDSLIKVVGNWLVELGELDGTFRRSEISALKAFLPNDVDTIRIPFAPVASNFPRRTVFFASVNPNEFLQDLTGNTRFWTIACESIDYRHSLDMQQIWAEFDFLYRNGETWHLTPEENQALTENNTGFEVRSHVEERVESHFDWNCPERLWRDISLTDVLLEIGVDRPTNGDRAHAKRALAKYPAVKEHRLVRGGPRLWRVPPKRRVEVDPIDQLQMGPRQW